MKVWPLGLPFVVALCAAWLHHGSATGVTLGAETLVNAGQTNQYQQTLAVNPTDANNIILSMKTMEDLCEPWPQLLYTTTGASGTWAASLTLPMGASDPVIQFDASGNAYAFYLDDITSAIDVQKSTTKGASWSSKASITAAGIDHPASTTDKTGGAFAGSVYVGGATGATFVIARTRNAGSTWSTTTVDMSGFAHFMSVGFMWGPTVLADGTLLIPVSSATYASGSNTDADLYSLKSTDGGVTFTVTFIATKVYPNTTTYPNEGAFQLGNFVAGPKSGGGQRVYTTISQVYASQPSAMVIYYTDDEGSTWNGPNAVISPSVGDNHGVGGCINLMVNAAGVLAVQFFGIVGVTSSTNYDIYFSYSKDFGATWAAPIKLNSAQSTFVTLAQGQPRSPGRDQVYGDVNPSGSFQTVWQDSRGGALTYTTYTRTVTVH